MNKINRQSEMNQTIEFVDNNCKDWDPVLVLLLGATLNNGDKGIKQGIAAEELIANLIQNTELLLHINCLF